MVTRLLKFILAACIALAATQTMPVCPEIEVWYDGQGHYRYLLSDWHADYVDGRISLQQQADFIHVVQSIPSNPIPPMIIAEGGTCFYGIENQAIHKKINLFCKKNQAKNLKEHIERLNHINKTSSNVEQSSMLFDHISPLESLDSTCLNMGLYVRSPDVLQAICAYKAHAIEKKELISILTSYIDGIGRCRMYPIINNYYSSIVKNCAHLETIVDEQTFIKIAENLRDDLLDVRIMLRLINRNRVPHIFIFAGHYHITNIKPCLSMLGYKKIYSIGNPNIWINDDNFDALPRKAQQKIEALFIAAALDLRAAFTDIFTQQILLEAQHRATPPAHQLLDLFTPIL
jgi:hypothetical protein